MQSLLNYGACVEWSDDQVVVGAGQPERIATPSTEGWSFWIQNFYQDGSPNWWRFPETQLLSKSQLAEIFPAPQPVAAEFADLDLTTYEKFFAQAQRQFQKNELRKVVLYARAQGSVRCHSQQLVQSILPSILKAKNLHPYGFWNPKHGWLGATPESLFRWLGADSVRLEALAGTVATAKSAELLRDDKLLREHRWVVEDIKNQAVDLGDIREDKLHVAEFAPLAHLRQFLTLNTTADWQALVDCLHPTAAVNGFPRETAQNLLRNLNEQVPRKYYGAPVGVFHPQRKGVCWVGLRGLQWQTEETKTQLEIFVGGGVLPESQLETEKDELKLKLQAVRQWLKV